MAADETGLPIQAAAERLGIHPRTLRRYISDGRLTAVRYTSQVVRIKLAELERFQDQNIRIETGTGTCYVPEQGSSAAVEKPVKSKARKPRARLGS